jgi:carbon storage regulator
MLVLTRKIGQQIILGDDIVITVVEVDRGRVRIGIDAPKAVQVMRRELLDSEPTQPPQS